MEQKKSIVSYADDDDEEDQSVKSSPKDASDSDHHHVTSTKYSSSKHDKGSSKFDLNQDNAQCRKERTRDERKSKEHHSSQSHHHPRQHFHSSGSSKEHHRDRDRDHHRRSRSPTHRQRRIRARSSRSRSRDSYRSRQERSSTSSKHSPKHKSRSCRKSKRDRSRSRSRESRSHRRDHRSKSNSPKRGTRENICQDSSDRRSGLATTTESIEKLQDQVAVANAVAKTTAPTSAPLPPPSLVTEQILPTIPKYYNAKAVNPLRLASQEEKRKLLWGDTKKDKPSNPTTNVWTNLKFQGEHGSQMTEKFRKLMGIKSNDDEGASFDNTKDSEISTTQEKLFQNLDMQYSVARMSTHTHRGVGLGFSNNRLQ